MDTGLFPKQADLLLRLSGQRCDHTVREFHALGFPQQVFRQRLLFQRLLHLRQMRDLVQKPGINLRRLVDAFPRKSTPKCLRDDPDSLVIDILKLFMKLFVIESREVIAHEAVDMLLERTDCLHQSALEVRADAHHFAGRLHLCGQTPLCRDEFVKRKPRHLHHTVVQHRLKAGIGFPGNRIPNLIQRVPESDLGSNLRDRVSCRLRCKRRGS